MTRTFKQTLLDSDFPICIKIMVSTVPEYAVISFVVLLKQTIISKYNYL